MREPEWIRGDVVLAIHRRQLAEHGGIDGVRDSGLLDSALARSKNLWAYSDPQPDIASLAAAYAYGIIKNHPFLDGNKRTGYAVCRTFVILNGFDFEATQEEKFAAFYAVASGQSTEAQLAEWLRLRLKRTD